MALAAVNGLLAKLAADEDLHDDLKQPQVQVAMRHWTGQARLPPEQAVKLMGDYRVMAVLQKIKALQTACQRANIPVPLDAVLRRERSLRLPGVQPEGQQPEGKGAAAAKKKKKKAEEGEEQEEGTTKETATPAVTGTPAAAAPAPAAVTTTTTEAAAAGAAGQRRGVVRRPPQTVAEWLHLLSPLLTLVFGVLYALARAVGKQGQEGAA